MACLKALVGCARVGLESKKPERRKGRKEERKKVYL
jgi:hypothetical protein